MPTTPARARRWIREGKATPFFRMGVFCVRLNQEPSGDFRQEVCVGIDPGSKMEGYTVKTEAATCLNVQAHAVTWVEDKMEARRNARRARRSRNLRYRKPRFDNRKSKKLAPSTKARWQWKLRVLRQLSLMYPVTSVVVEDIRATTHGKGQRWNASFSPLEIGKKWFYGKIVALGYDLHTPLGLQTYRWREELGLTKSKSKMSTGFSAHCVDSWVLANQWVGGHTKPENTEVHVIRSIRLNRRQLHRFKPSKGGIRKPYGGTISNGIKRGTLVKHPKHGLSYVGGYAGDRVSLHSLSGTRLCQNAKTRDLTILKTISTIPPRINTEYPRAKNRYRS